MQDAAIDVLNSPERWNSFTRERTNLYKWFQGVYSNFISSYGYRWSDAVRFLVVIMLHTNQSSLEFLLPETPAYGQVSGLMIPIPPAASVHSAHPGARFFLALCG